ncbi:MAG: efflux RND transporter periplasmic adaptor subunit [Candidatus Eisenbacteria bacterium]|nr:efflux RND transporter periplasmic adaptor subunit [Candidatus Eisenbacteria bacterium]
MRPARPDEAGLDEAGPHEAGPGNAGSDLRERDPAGPWLSSVAGCAKEKQAKAAGGGVKSKTAFPVDVQPVASRRVEAAITAVGSVDAFEIVQVTARVPGAIEKMHFKEGDQVREGDVLVEIEPERYRLATEEARAALEKAEAALAEAEAGLARREGANERTTGLIPGEEIGTWRTRVRSEKAEVAARRAAVELAERNQRDAQARAPFSGTIQTRDVQTGRYVQPGTLLTTLIRRDPLLLHFQVPESDAGRLSPGQTARFTVRNNPRVFDARLQHVGDAADAASRMVAVVAVIADPDHSVLRAGAFAEVVIPVGVAIDAPVVPQTAVRPSERGFLSYVIEGGLARERVLTLGLRTPEGLVEVREGLAPGESLVVRGGEALRDGAKVRVAAPAGGTRG